MSVVLRCGDRIEGDRCMGSIPISGRGVPSQSVRMVIWGRELLTHRRTEMPNAKPTPKRKRLKEVMPAVGAFGVSLSLTGGASAAAAVGPDVPNSSSRGAGAGHEIFLHEEEIFDVNLGTFYVFDKENAETPSYGFGEQHAQRRGCRAGRGCGRGCRGCRGCARGCGCGGGGVGVWGGCGGCSCSCCLSWGACRVC